MKTKIYREIAEMRSDLKVDEHETWWILEIWCKISKMKWNNTDTKEVNEIEKKFEVFLRKNKP